VKHFQVAILPVAGGYEWGMILRSSLCNVILGMKVSDFSDAHIRFSKPFMGCFAREGKG